MSQLTEHMFTIGEPFAKELHLELVDVEYGKEGGQNVLRFLIDKEGGVSLDDCEAFSRLIDAELDRLDPIEQNYVLQVSSPGIERPLKKAEDYLRFMGRPAQIKLFAPLDGQKMFDGLLRGFEDQTILLETEKQSIVHIPLEHVAKANLKFEE